MRVQLADKAGILAAETKFTSRTCRLAVNCATMVMNTQSALSVLAQVEKLTDSAKTEAQASGRGEFWQRDKEFISAVRGCLVSNDPDRIRWAFDQMRNLSQGFGSYCDDMKRLDSLLDELYDQLAQLVSAR